MNPSDNPSQAPSETAAPAGPALPDKFYISQDFKFGRESFSVTDGQNLICAAKLKMLTLKEHIDVYRDEAATQLVFTIQQTSMVAMSKLYVVAAATGQTMGAFRIQAMQSMVNEHWEILDSNNNPIGIIEQDTMKAMLGRFASIVPQTFVAKINGQPVCVYKEEMNMGVYFKMDIDFSADSAKLYDRTLGIAAAILLASRHMQTQ